MQVYIVELDYTVPIEAVERQLAEHQAFLERHYAAGILLASGPKVPRTGGIILARAARRQDIEEMILQDPFYEHGLASYKISEFAPRRTGNGFPALDAVNPLAGAVQGREGESPD